MTDLFLISIIFFLVHISNIDIDEELLSLFFRVHCSQLTFTAFSLAFFLENVGSPEHVPTTAAASRPARQAGPGRQTNRCCC